MTAVEPRRGAHAPTLAPIPIARLTPRRNAEAEVNTGTECCGTAAARVDPHGREHYRAAEAQVTSTVKFEPLM
ncbi:hypothetical protein SEA_FENRY_32 [Gordonia phage Fenry]|nr:hypothetical protein SEA_FENRY_32 [Gordonia phage Fenry]